MISVINPEYESLRQLHKSLKSFDPLSMIPFSLSKRFIKKQTLIQTRLHDSPLTESSVEKNNDNLSVETLKL